MPNEMSFFQLPDTTKAEKVRDLIRLAYRTAYVFSDDLDTQVGVLITDINGKLIVDAANSIPTGLLKKPERQTRPLKYKYVGHAERNAINLAARRGIKLANCTMIAPWLCCNDCALAIITAGITRIIGHKECIDKTPERWKEPIDLGVSMLKEAEIEIEIFSGPIGDVKILYDRQIWEP